MPVLVSIACGCVILLCCFEQSLSEEKSVCLRDLQRRHEHAGFVPSARVARVQAILAQFVNINERALCPRQLHLERD